MGYFLGIKGRKTRHLVIAKELVRTCDAFHYNVIPVDIIENINTITQQALYLESVKVLKKTVHKQMQRLRERDGWIYFENPAQKTPR